MAGGHGKEPPTAAIFQKKCGRWYFENADGREKPAKPRPVDTKNASRRPRHLYIDITDIHTLRHRYRYTYTDTDTDTQTQTHRQTHSQTDTQIHRHTDTQAHTHRHTYTDTHTHIHSQTYTQNDIGST